MAGWQYAKYKILEISFTMPSLGLSCSRTGLRVTKILSDGGCARAERAVDREASAGFSLDPGAKWVRCESGFLWKPAWGWALWSGYIALDLARVTGSCPRRRCCCTTIHWPYNAIDRRTVES